MLEYIFKKRPAGVEAREEKREEKKKKKKQVLAMCQAPC